VTADGVVDTLNTPTLRPPSGSPTTQPNIDAVQITSIATTATTITIVATSQLATATPTELPPAPTPTSVPPTSVPTSTPIPTPTPEPPTPTPEICLGAIPWYDAINYVGSAATVIGPVVSSLYASDVPGAPTFLNIGAGYPDASRFTALIWVEYRENFPAPPEDMYAGATVCVAGFIELYEGVAEILVTGPDQIWIP